MIHSNQANSWIIGIVCCRGSYRLSSQIIVLSSLKIERRDNKHFTSPFEAIQPAMYLIVFTFECHPLDGFALPIEQQPRRESFIRSSQLALWTFRDRLSLDHRICTKDEPRWKMLRTKCHWLLPFTRKSPFMGFFTVEHMYPRKGLA